MKPMPRINGLTIVNKPQLLTKKAKKKDTALTCLRED